MNGLMRWRARECRRSSLKNNASLVDNLSLGYEPPMGRTKTVSDAEVFSAIRQLLAAGGEKAVAFASVARATGLAGPTLVQRFGSRAGMMQAAHLAAWDALDLATGLAIVDCGPSAKGAQALLKSLSELQKNTLDIAMLCLDLRDAALRQRAKSWRKTVEAALSSRLGGGAAGRDAAALLFAAWQGQTLWNSAGGKGFRIKDAIRTLT